MISQNSSIHRNTFQSGVNKDFNKTLVPSESMVDAHNVSLIDNGVFFSVQNIKGTTHLQDLLTGADEKVLGVFDTKYKIDDTFDVPCLTIFTATAWSTFKIRCYDTVNDVVYELFEEVVGADYFTGDYIVDAKGLSENGVTTLYFTDNYNEPRKLRCIIDTGTYSPNYLNSFNLSLLRRGALGRVDLANITTGGSLFSGSYQFAYQMVSPEENKYTKWSLMSTPIMVFGEINGIPKAGYGLGSNKKILIDIRPSEAELANYTHFKLAVLENIYPEGATNLDCSVTELISVADYYVGGGDPRLNDVPFTTNLQNNLLPLSEVVVDHAPIEKVKTLEIQNNRLYFGNITYKNLEYNNGTPQITSGSILKPGFDPQDDRDASRTVGYYRDEVYRFAISYFDGAGNYSTPKPLDMSVITNNQSSQTGFKDMKFPSRDQVLGSDRYSLLNGTTPVVLGVQMTGIDNHPTWAKGFVILRRERLKNIQWQSPLVPMMQVYGIGAVLNYPSQAREQADSEAVDYPNAVPMGPNKTFVPMNLFLSKLRKIVKNGGVSGTGVSKEFEGESHFATSNNIDQSISLVYPPQTMYTQNGKYVFNQSHVLETVDAVKLKELRSSFSIEAGHRGAQIESSYSGTFYALHSDMYYYDDGHSGLKPALRSDSFGMLGYKAFDNFSEGSSLNGKDILLYNNLVTQGLSWSGVKPPTVLRCGVVDLSTFTPINRDSSLSFAAGGTTVASFDDDAFYETSGRGSASTEGTTYTNTLEIVNCVAGLEDDRYGSIDLPAEYIHTGDTIVFTEAELATVEAGGSLPKNLQVYGGDCIVSAHTFKITDTSYNVPNQAKYSTLSGESTSTVINFWNRAFVNNASGTKSVVTMPVAIENSDTYVQIYLESEFNGDVMDFTNLSVATGSTYLTNSLHGVNYNASESSCRVPLNYNYNLNLSKENNQKIFTAVDPSIPIITKLGARIAYSDIKLYQTQTEGFDIFRVLNYHDLLESYGDIHKLAVLGDSMYSLQSSAVSYIGIGERVLETTDANTLSVRSGDVIGNVIILDNRRGCQHLKSVRGDGNTMYFVDNINKTVNSLSGQSLSIISDLGMATEFRTQLDEIIPERELIGLYDPIKKEYLIGRINGAFCWVYNQSLNLWVSNYEFSNNAFLGGVYSNQKLYNLGKRFSSSYVSVNEMYTGNNTELMGVYVVPRIKVVANPDMEIAKVFDDILLVASDRLDTLDVLVERESALGNQTITGIDLDVSSRGEGNFRAKILRDSSNRRPRGIYGIYTIKWNSSISSDQVNLTSILTKYRRSENIF